MTAALRLAGLLILLGLGPALAGPGPGLDPFAAARLAFVPDVAVPAEAGFVEADGRAVRLGDLFGARPVILAPVYFTCPNLCGFTLEGLAGALRRLSLSPGRDYTLVILSFDPQETPADARTARDTLIARLGRPVDPAAIHALTGREPAIAAVTEAIGFRYRWDPQLGQYAHSAGLAILTPAGRTSRWLSGVSFVPRDLRLALTEAGDGRTGGIVDQLLLLCYHYDPETGRYSGLIQAALRIAGSISALGLAAGIGLTLRREARRRAGRHDP